MSDTFAGRLILVITISIASLYGYSYFDSQGEIYGDAMGYYMYLPSTFIYHNHKDVYDLPKDKHISPSLLATAARHKDDERTPKGYKLNQYTYGIALTELPFFCIAHAYEKIKKLPANGFSDTYYSLLKIGTLLYAIIALVLLFFILRKHFNYTLSALGIAFIFLGTNLLWFSLHQYGMAHVPLFLLYVLLIYFTIKVHEQAKLVYFLVLGFVVGFITLIRPTDIICLLVPLLYNVYNGITVRQKLDFIKNNYSKISAAIAAFIIPIIPQLIYWKKLSGSFIYYSYGSNQSFNWRHPMILEGLFYYANGWLPYCPIMIFAIFGMLLYKRIRPWAWCLWLMFPIYVYIIYSWYCYTYINGLGSRPMIHLYPLLAIALTAFIQFVSQKKWYIKLPFALISAFFIALNISYSMQQANGFLNSEESTFTYNYQTLFRMHLSYYDLVVNDNAEKQPDPDKIQKVKTLACEDFKDSVSDRFILNPAGSSKYFYRLQNEEFLPKIPVSLKYDKTIFKGGKWLKASGFFYCTEIPGYYKHLFVIEITHGDKTIKYVKCSIENKIGIADNSCVHKNPWIDHFELNRWGYVYFYARIPEEIREGDEIHLLLWNIGKKPIDMRDLCIELCK